MLNTRAKTSPEIIEPPAKEQLPAVIPPAKARHENLRRFRLSLLLLALLLGSIGAGYWWLHPRAGLPAGIAWSNGRLEADEIDIDTKFAGRIARLLADEGSLVKAGQVLALMDTQDLQASLNKAAALVMQAQRTITAAQADLEQQKTQVLLAQQQLDRARFLVPKGFETKEVLDQRQQQMNGAIAAQNAAIAKIGEAEFGLAAATHDVQLYQVDIAEICPSASASGFRSHRSVRG